MRIPIIRVKKRRFSGPFGKTLKYPPVKSTGMKKILTIACTLMLCMVLALVAGCSQPAAPTAATPAPTAVQTTEATAAPTTVAPATTAASLTPGPTQTLSEIWSIEVQVASNGEAINPQVITTLRGGKGMNVVPEIDVKITRSDGVVETDRMVQPLYVGKTITLAGTSSNNDRAEVWAITPNGEKVKIYDAYIPFRSYN
jgi:ABC-type transport system substrate-binding protein